MTSRSPQRTADDFEDKSELISKSLLKLNVYYKVELDLFIEKSQDTGIRVVL